MQRFRANVSASRTASTPVHGQRSKPDNQKENGKCKTPIQFGKLGELTPRPCVVTFHDPRLRSSTLVAVPFFRRPIGVIGFYYPSFEEDCDKLCGASFLGNNYDLMPGRLHLVAPIEPDKPRCFRNAEAAFQALKFWSRAGEFENLSGPDAFRLKRNLHGQEDPTFAGLHNNWLAMLTVLHAKFSPGSSWAQLLLETGDAYLLEHNSLCGRDHIWSNNNVGDGTNWLGLQLMLIREQLCLQSCKPWTDFASRLIDIETGQPHDVSCRGEWQSSVLSATKALLTAIGSKHTASLARVSVCPRGGQTDSEHQSACCSKSCKTQYKDATTTAYQGIIAWRSWRPLSARRNRRASSASACPPRKNVPSHDGWEVHVDPSSGTIFYYHRQSGHSSWDPPPCDGADQYSGSAAHVVHCQPPAAHASQIIASQKVAGEVVEKQPPEPSEQLVDEWREATDPSGKVYYWCARTRETRWEPPC